MNKWTLAESWNGGKIWTPITATIRTEWDTQAEAQEWADMMEEAFKGLGTFRDGYRIKVVAPN
jgi:hypothetical protein